MLFDHESGRLLAEEYPYRTAFWWSVLARISKYAKNLRYRGWRILRYGARCPPVAPAYGGGRRRGADRARRGHGPRRGVCRTRIPLSIERAGGQAIGRFARSTAISAFCQGKAAERRWRGFPAARVVRRLLAGSAASHGTRVAAEYALDQGIRRSNRHCARRERSRPGGRACRPRTDIWR